MSELEWMMKRHDQAGPCAGCGHTVPNCPLWASGWLIEAGGMICPGCLHAMREPGSRARLGAGWFLVNVTNETEVKQA